uniref:Uncharacterized protein n=1 Tax=Salmonella sp. TaxID=599 RepID=A0A482ETF3_SALSP|nr:hypothetical protein NNIBIDOC_00058 [Salmonella sp.]
MVNTLILLIWKLSRQQLKRCAHNRSYRNGITVMTCQSDCTRVSLPLQITLVAEINKLLDDGAVDYNSWWIS